MLYLAVKKVPESIDDVKQGKQNSKINRMKESNFSYQERVIYTSTTRDEEARFITKVTFISVHVKGKFQCLDFELMKNGIFR